MRLEPILLLILLIQSNAIVNQNPVKPGCTAVNPKYNLVLEQFTGKYLTTCQAHQLSRNRDLVNRSFLYYEQEFGTKFKNILPNLSWVNVFR